MGTDVQDSTVDVPVTDTPVSTPEAPETPSEGVTTVPSTESTPETASPETSPKKEDKPEDDIVEIDEQDMEATLDAILNDVGNKPFRFKDDAADTSPKPEDKPAESTDTTDPILKELTEVADILTTENQKFQEELAAERIAKDEALEIAKGVDEVWNALAAEMPIIEQYATAKANGEEFKLPPIFREDIQKKLQEHPIVGPLNKALMNGEELPISDFVKALASHRRTTMPRVSDAKNDVLDKNPSDSRSSPLGSMGGIKPVSFT